MAQQGNVPRSEPHSVALDVLQRAHRLEQQGRVHEACDVLEQFANSAWPWSRSVLEETRASCGGPLCQSAMALFTERRGRLFRRRAIRRAFVGGSFALAYLAFAVFATHQGLRGSSWWFLGSAMAVPIVPLLTFGAVWTLWRRKAWQTPRWATVESVTVLTESLDDTGPPTCIAKLVLETEPTQVRRVIYPQGLTVEAGMRLLIVEHGSDARFLP